MTKQLGLTRSEIEFFIHEACLDEEEQNILWMRKYRKNVSQQLEELHMERSAYFDKVNIIIEKYNYIREKFPEKNLPKAFKSKQEKIMDEN